MKKVSRPTNIYFTFQKKVSTTIQNTPKFKYQVEFYTKIKRHKIKDFVPFLILYLSKAFHHQPSTISLAPANSL